MPFLWGCARNSAHLPFGCLSAPSVSSKRIFSVYSVMFFIMKLMYCLLFLFLYSKCWIIGHGSVWPGSDVLSLGAVFFLYSISGTSLFWKSVFLLWKNFCCVPVFHNIYMYGPYCKWLSAVYIKIRCFNHDVPIIPAGQFTVQILKMFKKKEALIFLEIFYSRR